MKKKRCALTGALLLFAFLFSLLPVHTASAAEVQSTDEAYTCAGKVGDIEVSSRFWELLFGKKKSGYSTSKNNTGDELMLCPGGDVFGVKIARECVAVAEADEECTLKCGDIIISVDGERIRTLGDMREIIEKSNGKTLRVVVERRGERFEADVTPKIKDGSYKIGAVLKDGVAGIGTVTYFDPATGQFGGLGHGICDASSGEVVKMNEGVVTGVVLGGIDKSHVGDPGELTGILTDEVLGELYANTNEGVFGKLDTPPTQERTALPVGHKCDVHEGDAMIYSTLKNGYRAGYKIKIFDVDYTSTGSKSFKVKVTDDVLKSITGGIVRGMSGSPIIQDGKLVGAVTHVMVANPTEGYGIFIENMLNAAENQVQPKAA